MLIEMIARHYYADGDIICQENNVFNLMFISGILSYLIADILSQQVLPNNSINSGLKYAGIILILISIVRFWGIISSTKKIFIIFIAIIYLIINQN